MVSNKRNDQFDSAIRRISPGCHAGWRSKRCRQGLTLIEILMTIFVLAIGLLGVAALMPVGSYQMQRGQIAQRVSEIGPAALDLLEASDMHSPERWGRETDSPRFDDIEKHGSNDEWVRRAHHSSDGTAPSSVPSESNYLIEYLRSNGSTNLGSYKQADSATYESGDVVVARRCEPFAIDPLYMYQVGMNPFVSALNDPYGTGDAMPRITVSGVTSQAAAESIFQNDEDLIVVEDEDSGFPSGRAVWGPSNSNPVKAKSEGNYSWLATFSPGEKATGSDPKQWTVSVAVFYKRPLGLRDNEGKNASQWTVPFSTSGGNNGYTTVRCHGENGENDPVDATLIFDADSESDKFDQDAGDSMRIKRRMWGLVTFADGSHKRARWYRVGTVQKPLKNDDSDTKNNIHMRLIGPDLPKIPSDASDDDVITSARITFFEGLEGVFTRAMRAGELPVGQP
jgi:prepilin-type N-terminal cleavage/methylation domain-containing protein